MKKIRNGAMSAAVAVCLAFSFQPTPMHAASRQAPPPAQQVAASPGSPGAKSYAANCAICHGDHREGILPGFPPLLGIGHQMTDPQIVAVVQQGKERMPGFPNIQGQEMTSLLQYLASPADTPLVAAATGASKAPLSQQAQAGAALFQQNCAFCHGRDTMGGETGPDLTRSKIVLADKNGELISEVVRDGRPAKKMPPFNFSAPEIASLVAFIHAEEVLAASNKGGRRGVDVADLQTGNVEAGRRYFEGAGGCSKCHSPTGDLAGIAKRYEGLHLEERMLYPEGAKSKVIVTLPSGKRITGTLADLDEFTVALREADGSYHSWPVSRVKYKVDDPVEAHVDQFPKYTDADIHNLMAYLQTLR